MIGREYIETITRDTRKRNRDCEKEKTTHCVSRSNHESKSKYCLSNGLSVFLRFLCVNNANDSANESFSSVSIDVRNQSTKQFDGALHQSLKINGHFEFKHLGSVCVCLWVCVCV